MRKLLFANLIMVPFISWQANSYTPYFYQGKVLPTNNSEVAASFELLSDGKVSDISRKNIRWYLDNQLYKSGTGLKTISFVVDQFKRDDYLVKISVDGVDYPAVIPVASPEVVIDNPYYNNSVRPGTNLFRALYYFFNIKNIRELAHTWTANGIATQSRVNNPDILELEIPAQAVGSEINLNLSVKNKKNNFEFADDRINLNVTP